MFAFAMACYPDVQRRAQAEIDSVVGRGRLPTFGDRPQLLYVEALLRELFRWRPVLPLAIPRRSSQVRYLWCSLIRGPDVRLVGRALQGLLHPQG